MDDEQIPSLKVDISYRQIQQAVRTQVDEALAKLSLQNLIQDGLKKLFDKAEKSVNDAVTAKLHSINNVSIAAMARQAIERELTREVKNHVENQCTKMVKEAISITLTNMVKTGISVELKESWRSPGVTLDTRLVQDEKQT